MKKEVGASAGIFAILAVFLNSIFGVGSSASNKPAGTPSPASEKPAESLADRIDGPWVATRTFFNQSAADDPTTQPDDDLLLANLTSPRKPVDPALLRRFLGLPPNPSAYRMWTIVATVTDPAHTRMPLALDRQIAAIQGSLQVGGWYFSGQWLPWLDRLSPATGGLAERRRQRRLQRRQEEVPGILIFHRARIEADQSGSKLEALFVLLVPETPTSGIGGVPFFTALNLANVLTSPDHPVGLLAPTFSGSFDSLATLLLAWNKPPFTLATYKLPVYGGSISSMTSAANFTQRTHLRFHSGISNSDDYDQAFCEILKTYRIQPADAAYLVEDQTVFGSIQGKGTCAVPAYVFPRDIAQLRNVYQDQPSGTDARKLSTAQPGVNFSIKDADSGEDSTPTFSGVQSPLSQDAVVNSILEEFRRRRTRLVYISATNVLDTLFLARVVHEKAPDTRAMVGSSDILFLPAAAQSSLTGTLFLSSYPLSLQAEEWLNSNPRRRVPFAGASDEGIYNVTQFLLRDIHASNPPDLRAYRQFDANRPFPGLWLMTLDKAGFAPLQWLPSDSPGWLPSDPRSHPGAVQLDLPDPPRSWYVTAALVVLGTGWFCFLMLRCNFSTHIHKPAWFTLRMGHLLRGPRLVAITGVTLSLSAIAWTLLVPTLVPLGSTVSAWTLIATSAPVGFHIVRAGLLLSFLAPVVTLAVLLRKERPQKLGLEGLFYATLTIGLFLEIVTAWYQSCQLSLPAARLFAYRALDISSISSPALPLLLLEITSFAGFLLIFKRFVRAGLGRPRLEFSGFPQMGPLLEAAYRSINAQIMARGLFRRSSLHRPRVLKQVAVAGIFLMVCIAAGAGFKYVAAFEGLAYNIALVGSLAALLFFLVTTCRDLILIWNHLKTLLGFIALLPLKGAFERVTKEWPRRPIWASSARLSKPLIARQMQVAMFNRQVDSPDPEALGDFQSIWRSSLQKLASSPNRRPSLPQPDSYFGTLLKHEQICSQLAMKIIQRDLMPVWSKCVNDESQTGSACAETSSRRYASDFVALQYCRYIIYVVSQLKNIAWCISFGFLMLVVSLNAYHPQSPLFLGRLMLVLLAIIGILVVRVFADMERNGILSRIAGSQPGELNRDFWLHLITMGILPLTAVLSHLFPSISGFFSAWISPTVQAIH